VIPAVLLALDAGRVFRRVQDRSAAVAAEAAAAPG
jgi:hypothetical protein